MAEETPIKAENTIVIESIKREIEDKLIKNISK